MPSNCKFYVMETAEEMTLTITLADGSAVAFWVPKNSVRGEVLAMLKEQLALPEPPQPAPRLHCCPVCGVIPHECEHLVRPAPAAPRRMKANPEFMRVEVIHGADGHEEDAECVSLGCVPEEA